MAIPAKLSGKSIKLVVFNNDAGPITLFTVTGTVIVNVACTCLINVASAAAGSISVGISTATAALMPVTVASLMVADEIWHDATPDANIELSTVVNESIIAGAYDIILTATAQIDTGRLEFYCFWSALSANGLVVPA